MTIISSHISAEKNRKLEPQPVGCEATIIWCVGSSDQADILVQLPTSLSGPAKFLPLSPHKKYLQSGDHNIQ